MHLRSTLGFVVVAAIAIASIAIAVAVRESQRNNFDRSQDEEAVRAARQAEAVAALSVGQLSSATAFYQVESPFSQHEFEVVADSMFRTGAMSATAYVRSVSRDARARFESSHGYPITERGGLGQLQRAGDRPLYFPLTFAAADGLPAQLPIGYDIGSDKLRGSYLYRAIDSGRAAATPAMRLPIGGTGINVFWPVYRDGSKTGTVAQRRAALIGFTVGGFQIADLTQVAHEALPGASEVAFVERGKPVSGPDLPRDDSASAPIHIADRTWLLVLRDPERPGVESPLLIGIVGISLAALLSALVLVWSRNERMQELQRQAGQDSLTGLKNRRRFEEGLRAELARSRRYGVPGALLMLDLDNFKQVNDTLGHPMGDKVIEEIAGVLRGRTREVDVLARLGGDEFAIVLPHCGSQEARSVATEIAQAIRDHVPRERGMPSITASIGIAMFGPTTPGSLDSILTHADTAMYAAKHAGRDAVRVAAPGNGKAEGASYPKTAAPSEAAPDHVLRGQRRPN